MLDVDYVWLPGVGYVWLLSMTVGWLYVSVLTVLPMAG